MSETAASGEVESLSFHNQIVAALQESLYPLSFVSRHLPQLDRNNIPPTGILDAAFHLAPVFPSLGVGSLNKLAEELAEKLPALEWNSQKAASYYEQRGGDGDEKMGFLQLPYFEVVEPLGSLVVTRNVVVEVVNEIGGIAPGRQEDREEEAKDLFVATRVIVFPSANDAVMAGGGRETRMTFHGLNRRQRQRLKNLKRSQKEYDKRSEKS